MDNTPMQQDGKQPPALPPGPPCRWRGVAELRAMGRDYLGFMQEQQRRHGDVVCMRLGVYRDYSLFHPEQVRDVLLGAHEQLIRWERGVQVFSAAHGHSVLVAEGPAWSARRRLLQPGFGPKRVEGFASSMVEASQQALGTWPAAASFDLDFEQAMTQLTMDVILRTLFGSGSSQDAREAESAVRVLGQVAMREMYWPMSAPLWAPWKARKRHALRLLDRLIRRHIAARQQGGDEGGDLLAMLRQLRFDNGAPLDDEALRDECMTIFLAGHETSATALTWWGWCMAAHPGSAARAADEVQALLGGRAPAMADIARLPFLTQTIKETMRLYPPAPALLTRRLQAPLRVGGWTIPRGATLRLTPGVMHRDARWFPAPDAFNPDRFGPDAPELPRGAYMPFGAGPRVCLGSHFAMTEITLVAAMLLQRYELLRIPGEAAPTPELNITLRPAKALRLRLQRRA